MKKFHPTLFPTLFTIPAVLALLALGTWQVYRLQWKNDLITTITQEMAKPAIALPLNNNSLPSLTYQRVILQGKFLHDTEFYRYQQNEGRQGYEVITPFQREEGPVILVIRGWVPMEKRDPTKRPEGQTEGIVTLEGVIMDKEKPGLFTPDNNVVNNVWFWIDEDAIASHTGLVLQPVVVRAIGNPPAGGVPIPLAETLHIRNDHLQYALIWYSFAIILSIIYFLYHRKDVNKLERAL